MKKRALITGITGQDGSYLSELLLENGYEVHGLTRRPPATAQPVADRRSSLHYADLNDTSSLIRAIHLIQPDEIYNLGAQSYVSLSFEQPEYTAQADALGTLRILEAVRVLGMAGQVRIYQASTSELFGLSQETPQRESTPFHPRSPYGVAKLYAHYITVNYREAYGMYACNGILFNHDSPRRPESFVCRKVTRGVARITVGLDSVLSMGNIDSKRDWGHARDFVKAMYLMLQQDAAADYVVATGVQHSVRDVIETAFEIAGTRIEWRGSGTSEVGVDANSGRVVVEIDPAFFRPSEVDNVVGDPSKARVELGWEPVTKFRDLVGEMVAADLKSAAKEASK